MMGNTSAGFSEIEHTADWELEVWAPDMATLLAQAAKGMYVLSETRLQPGPRVDRSLVFSIFDLETLLVDFLSELLYLGEDEGLAFDTYELDLDGERLRAQISGAPIASQAKEIKAVTYHNLEIREGDRGLEVRIVFDV
jgi:SHS2 domain-containing protein